ncbi:MULTISPECIES: hypothetical protein [Streptacidiphilus]|uniref:MmyB-like transcription regulator ligand binding domain-containing protein n=1 Tax=Streptacidiphilus cavernicola TaxID=3342716 RepID=A0ABV6UP55_9ACTN|nr:hypothetical protein [Streptacidiphilus jeojiense]
MLDRLIPTTQLVVERRYWCIKTAMTTDEVPRVVEQSLAVQDTADQAMRWMNRDLRILWSLLPESEEDRMDDWLFRKQRETRRTLTNGFPVDYRLDFPARALRWDIAPIQALPIFSVQPSCVGPSVSRLVGTP